MEKKTQRELERALLLKLYDAVNSQEELDWVKSELALLGAVGAVGGAA
jgi:hypothetical protein